MRPFMLGALLFALGACVTAEGQALRDAVATKGAEAYDAGLENAEWFMCYAASVGSVKRRYGKSQETADAWRAICDGQDGVILIGPEE